MNREIEEMAREVIGDCDECSKCSFNYSCIAYEYAKKFYNAGYRKSVDVAREIFEEIDKRLEALLKFYPCNGEVQDAKTFVNFHWKHIRHSIMCDYDTELRKKYESEGEE